MKKLFNKHPAWNKAENKHPPSRPKNSISSQGTYKSNIVLTNVWCDICIHVACTVKNAKKNTVQKKLNIITGSVCWHQTGHIWHRSQCLAAVWISFLDYLPQALRGLIL